MLDYHDATWQSFDIGPILSLLIPIGQRHHSIRTTHPPTLPPGPTIPTNPIPPTSSDLFERSMQWVFQEEGGYQNHPDDIGNWTGGVKGVGVLKGTNWGISAASYPELDIVNLTKEQAKEIYRRDYWGPSGASTLEWPLCLLVFDTGILHGVGASTAWLREVGPNPYAFAYKRLQVYVNSERWGIFGRGWVSRTAKLLGAMVT